jgi:predicted amidophosphoribosyltransferase
MKCTNCGEELLNSEKFCSHCAEHNANYVPELEVEGKEKKSENEEETTAGHRALIFGLGKFCYGVFIIGGCYHF